MSMQANNLQGGGSQQQNAGTGSNENAADNNVQISPPQIDRQDGPFEHSGEVAGWTAEEERENKEQETQQEGRDNP